MMNEEFLVYLWQQKIIHFNQLALSGTVDKIQIINVGSRNKDSGPDFFNAKVKIGDTTWAGNIEIHVKSSDWELHKHHNDDSYDNIILHVVFMDDAPVFRKNGEKICQNTDACPHPWSTSLPHNFGQRACKLRLSPDQTV